MMRPILNYVRRPSACAENPALRLEGWSDLGLIDWGAGEIIRGTTSDLEQKIMAEAISRGGECRDYLLACWKMIYGTDYKPAEPPLPYTRPLNALLIHSNTLLSNNGIGEYRHVI